MIQDLEYIFTRSLHLLKKPTSNKPKLYDSYNLETLINPFLPNNILHVKQTFSLKKLFPILLFLSNL